MKQKISLCAVLCTLAVLLLAACGGESTGVGTTTAHATLQHVPSGTATLNWDPGTHALTVKLSLSGLAPSSIHPAHIHTGSCSNQGNVLYPLQNVAADATGVGSATTTVPNVTGGIAATGWYVNVHNGPGLSPAEQFLPIVCGDVANPNASTTTSQSVQVAMKTPPQASTGQNASGTAELTLSASTLTVKLTLTGLAPNSKHAAHIHEGSCESQGKVVYPLENIAADASGNATVTSTVPNVSSIPSSGWYVNVHSSTDLSTQTGFDPITCGNVS